MVVPLPRGFSNDGPMEKQWEGCFDGLEGHWKPTRSSELHTPVEYALFPFI